MKKTWSAVSFLIIALLSITSMICANGALSLLASRQVDTWLSDQPKVFTSQLTDEQKDGFVSALQKISNDGDGFIVVSRDSDLLQSGATLYTFSTVFSPNGSEAPIGSLTLLGTVIIDKTVLESVASAAPDGYAGYGNDASSRIASLPSIQAGLHFRVNRLASGEDLGEVCMFAGLDSKGFRLLVDSLSSEIGVDSETLTQKKSGSSFEPGLVYPFCVGAFSLLSIVLCLLMTTHSLLELKTLGVHLMLGWSKFDFVCDLLSTQALQIVVVMPIGLIGALATLDGFSVNLAFVGFALASVLPAAAVVLTSMAVSVIPIAFVKPVEAIHERYSQRGFYGLIIAAYLICLAAVFSGCLYIDQPLAMYSDLSRTRTAWSEYEGWYVVRDFGVGGDRFTGNPMGLSKEMYAWYADHEHDDGVYLANAARYEESAIRSKVEASTQPRPFWYLAASPSYLEKIGIVVPEDLLEKAERGSRVYLLPRSLDASEEKGMKEFLVASRRPYDSNIVTPFMDNPEYEFASYDAGRELFTWSTDSNLPVVSDGFVIAVITAKNMAPFESESLVASGLENAYVKLDERVASNLLDKNSEAPIGGSVSARFATVGNYIDGLRKTLEELFVLFSVVLVILVATIAIMVACLIGAANRMSAREISVKYVLGFGAWGLYHREILLVTGTALMGAIASAFFGSSAGVLVGIALIAVSNLVIFVAARKRSATTVLQIVSRE
ncbi:MAG: hypothetical protein SOW20_03710 [Berryella intestinalis]|uniref:hypothetical protein n=1 Tax=Berryella intestinalis TaxID=1531429 RepID=UPI002A506012|nr:hypothetical protein [Berryella intestinalis]MDD7368550.1 hypothetical protein [Berryella intestinalis]MDY3129115.1 hypothetical protein [Berryella intestinalis]